MRKGSQNIRVQPHTGLWSHRSNAILGLPKRLRIFLAQKNLERENSTQPTSRPTRTRNEVLAWKSGLRRLCSPTLAMLSRHLRPRLVSPGNQGIADVGICLRGLWPWRMWSTVPGVHHQVGQVHQHRLGKPRLLGAYTPHFRALPLYDLLRKGNLDLAWLRVVGCLCIKTTSLGYGMRERSSGSPFSGENKGERLARPFSGHDLWACFSAVSSVRGNMQISH